MVLIPKFSKNIKNLIKVKDVSIDGPIFKVHCKFTAAMLFFACATVCWKEYVGDPMQCIVGSGDMDKDYLKAIQTFCWINSTFTLAPLMNRSVDNRIYHTYYQWVGFVLFFQGLVFYFPSWIWKHAERGLMKHLRGDDARKLVSTEERARKKIELANYFIQRLKSHVDYTLQYWFCELLCLVNVVTQAALLERFFNSGAKDTVFLFSLDVPILDLELLKFPGAQTVEQIFPFTTKCDFHKYGPSGTIQNYDALCVLGLNVFHRFIFLMMWYWFLLLIVLLTPVLLYRVLLIFCPPMKYLLLRAPGRKGLLFETEYVARKLVVTDWWVLYSLKSNIDPILFEDIILELFRKLSTPQTRLMESKKMLGKE